MCLKSALLIVCVYLEVYRASINKLESNLWSVLWCVEWMGGGTALCFCCPYKRSGILLHGPQTLRHDVSSLITLFHRKIDIVAYENWVGSGERLYITRATSANSLHTRSTSTQWYIISQSYRFFLSKFIVISACMCDGKARGGGSVRSPKNQSRQ